MVGRSCARLFVFFMAVRQVAAQGAFAQISVTGCPNDWTAVSDVDIFGHLGGVYG